MSNINQWTQDIHQGDVLETLEQMPADSVHMAMCSPPYYGLRDYGEDGQIGLEESLGEYVARLVEVGEELRRVLRDDGSWWLNLGDTYSGGSIVRSDGEWTRPGDDGYEEAHNATVDSDGRRSMSPLGRKNKMLVPHRVAIALQESGWIVRSDCVWAKPNPMPDPTKDRLNETKEFIFHLTPQPDYYFNLDAIREPHSEWTKNAAEKGYTNGDVNKDRPGSHSRGGIHDPDVSREDTLNPAGKNPGDVFEVTTKPFPDAHFAVYPPELCEKPIKATCPEDGIVLDPFCGAGTTCLVAKRLGRRFVGIDLNPEYVAMAQKRVGVTVDQPELLLDDGETTLTSFSD